MKPAHAVRGAALPETALVLTGTLAMVFGIIQIGVIGFLQIMVDGAAFVAAHEYALGNTSTTSITGYKQVAQRIFPLMSGPVIDANSPDTSTVAVNYNVSQTTKRHGGVSLVLGTHLQATVTNTAPGGVLGVGVAALSKMSVHGSAIEPQNWVSNNAYNVNATAYSGSSTQTPFLTNVQNAPANYISQHEMAQCTAKKFPAQCPNGSIDVLALGTAAFLDHDNWQRTTLGVGAYSAGNTFGEMLCHQQKFAAAALIFVPVLTATQLQAITLTDSTTDVTGVVGQIYSWDFPTVKGGGYGGTETKYGLFPVFPAKFC